MRPQEHSSEAVVGAGVAGPYADFAGVAGGFEWRGERGEVPWTGRGSTVVRGEGDDVPWEDRAFYVVVPEHGDYGQ